MKKILKNVFGIMTLLIMMATVCLFTVGCKPKEVTIDAAWEKIKKIEKNIDAGYDYLEVEFKTYEKSETAAEGKILLYDSLVYIHKEKLDIPGDNFYIIYKKDIEHLENTTNTTEIWVKYNVDFASYYRYERKMTGNIVTEISDPVAISYDPAFKNLFSSLIEWFKSEMLPKEKSEIVSAYKTLDITDGYQWAVNFTRTESYSETESNVVKTTINIDTLNLHLQSLVTYFIIDESNGYISEGNVNYPLLKPKKTIPPVPVVG